MTKTPLISLLTSWVLAWTAHAVERAVIIVAGQSNVLNWHAAAALLPADARDAGILFYYETGAPPGRGAAVPFNSSSRGEWTTLGPQRQEPFVKYQRDFFGPEISLARQLTACGVTNLAVIKFACFGTSLAVDWNPGATTGNMLYHRLRRHVATAVQLLRERGDEPRITGFFWMQGETDGANATHAAAYGDNLTAFIARARKDFVAPALPFLLGRIGPSPAKGYSYQSTVRSAQVRVAETVACTGWVDTDDLARDTDGIHLLAAGVLTLGERMAAPWMRISGLSPQP